MPEDSPPRFRLTGTTAGPRSTKRREPTTEWRPPEPPAPPEPEPPRRIPESARFRRGDVYSRPVVDGREVQDNAWSRLRGRLRTLATSEG